MKKMKTTKAQAMKESKSTGGKNMSATKVKTHISKAKPVAKSDAPPGNGCRPTGQI